MSDNPLLQTLMQARPELLRFLRLRGASPEEAEDILQTIAVKLSAQPPGAVEQPRAYLYRMATNQFLLTRRGEARQRQRDEAWVEAASEPIREIDPQPSAETALIASQSLARLQAVIDAMPERTRIIFRLFRLEGVAQKTIAADLGISISAVEKHLARAYGDLLAARKKDDEDKPIARHLMREQGQQP